MLEVLGWQQEYYSLKFVRMELKGECLWVCMCVLVS